MIQPSSLYTILPQQQHTPQPPTTIFHDDDVRSSADGPSIKRRPERYQSRRRRVEWSNLLLLTMTYLLQYPIVHSFQPSRHPAFLSRHPFRPIPSARTVLRMAQESDAEWNAIMAALKMYKAAYGDTSVPPNFVVPNMAPWPEPAWGILLGSIVTDIQKGQYENRRPQLEQLGLLRATPKLTLQQVVTTVRRYQQENEVVEVPLDFVVPPSWPNQAVRGLPLGKQIQVLRNSKNPKVRAAIENLFVATAETGKVEEKATTAPDTTTGKEPKPVVVAAKSKPKDETTEEPKATEVPSEVSSPVPPELAQLLGDPTKLSANDVRFKNVYVALNTYKGLYGDLLVPQPFVVPRDSEEWPEDTWELRLGARVNAIRSQGTFVNNNPARRVLLDKLGFVWSPPKDRRGGRRANAEGTAPPKADDTLPPLEALLGDGIRATDAGFGTDFGAPTDDKPLATSPSWNLEGARMPESAGAVPDELPEHEYMEEEDFNESLRIAAEKALECGIIEGMQPNKRVIKGKQEKNIPWFNDDFGDDFVFEDVVDALTKYKSMHGDFYNLTKNFDFVVPVKEEVTGFLEDDSVDLHEMDATSRAAAAVASFDEGGLDPQRDFVAAEIQRMQQEAKQESETVFQSTTVVDPVSETDPNIWDEHLAGMKLGNIVRRIRDGSLEVKHIPERKEILDALDFDWGDPKYFIDIPFEKAMCAMYAYYLVRGDMFVYEDFIMPDEDPWPQALAGYELGMAVRRIRELQNFLEAYHPEKVSLLRMIDFAWFDDTIALPLDPNEREMTPETLKLIGLGHPDYAKMIDIPMGLPDKIIADGPYADVEHDPKLWWRKWHNWDLVADYWYQQGRRDNAYVLRKMGYPKMAEEHEAKYGPGLFQSIDEVMDDLRTNDVREKPLETKKELLDKLNLFRRELLGCTDLHPEDRDKLLVEFDTQMLLIMEDKTLDLTLEDELGPEVELQESVKTPEEIEEEMFNKEDFEVDLGLPEIDIEDELGLDMD